MKAVILAGGYGFRLYEKTKNIPKPMVKIGGKPIIWHIMKIFSKYGVNEFIICGGYKLNIIKKYFKNYLNQNKSGWKVKVIDTGKNTMTGGRIKRIKTLLNKNEEFFFTYGDGISDINLKKLLVFHKKKNKLATVTAVIPPGRYGVLNIKNKMVKQFSEKKRGGDGYINGGFFVLKRKALDFIKNDKTIWEQDPMKKLSEKNQLAAYIHNGFWQSMDTYRDLLLLDEICKKQKFPWEI